MYWYDDLVSDYRAAFTLLQVQPKSVLNEVSIVNPAREQELEQHVLDKFESLRRMISRQSKDAMLEGTREWTYEVFFNLLLIVGGLVASFFSDALVNRVALKLMQQELAVVKKNLHRT